MPECTEAERAYLDACLRDGLAPSDRKLRDAVTAERFKPELREEVVLTQMALRRAIAANDAAWERLGGNIAIERLFAEVATEAVRRLKAEREEPKP